jgi:hypothetical protein
VQIEQADRENRVLHHVDFGDCIDAYRAMLVNSESQLLEYSLEVPQAACESYNNGVDWANHRWDLVDNATLQIHAEAARAVFAM